MGFKIKGDITTQKDISHEEFIIKLSSFLKNEGFHFRGKSWPITDDTEKDETVDK